MPPNLENSAWPQDWKRSVFIPIPKKGNAKECSNYCTITLISHAIKVMLKISKLGFDNIWTKNFQMFKMDLEKAEEPEIKLPTSAGSQRNPREFQENIYFCFIDYALTVRITTNHGKFLKRWECQTTLPASWEICMQIKKQQLEPDMEQQLVWPPWTLDGKESACNVGDLGLIPRSGRSSGEENDNLPQYSCLENPMERGAWWATVHGVAKSQSVMSNWHYYCYIKAVYCHPV